MKKDNEALAIIKKLNSAQLWIFIALRSFCDSAGKVSNKVKQLHVKEFVDGADIGGGQTLDLKLPELKDRLNQLAYYGIVGAMTNAQPNDVAKQLAYRKPVVIGKKFLDILPQKYMRPEIVEMIEVLKLKLLKSDDLKRDANDTIKRLRDEIRLTRKSFVPEFELYKGDGSIDRRSVQFQRLWAWFVLLEIEPAFEKVVTKKGKVDPKKTPDYRTMAVWIAVYGLDQIEALLHKFYMSRRIEDLKKDAGDRWPETVLRFIYGSLRKSHENTKNKSTTRKDWEKEYEPRGGW